MARLLALLVALVGGAGVLAAATTTPAAAGGRVIEVRDVAPMLDAYLPPDPAVHSPAVLFVHGGGWTGGSRRWWAGHARALSAHTGWPSFTVDYTLGAELPYRVQPGDVRRAVAWVRANARAYGIDPDRVALVGSSAGGHLAMLAGTTGAGVRAVASLAGVADLPAMAARPTGRLVKTMVGASYADAPERWRALSPVAHVDAGDPPMLLVASEDDPLVPSSQSREMAAALRHVGVDVELHVLPGAEHVLGTKAMPTVEAWLRRVLAQSE